MKHFHLVEAMNKMPEGVPLEKASLRLCCAAALAVSMHVPMAPPGLSDVDVQRYFFDNCGPLRAKLFEMNESMNFNVDRSLEQACKLYCYRYSVAFRPNLTHLMEGFHSCHHHFPEFGECKVSASDVSLILEYLAD